MFRFGGWQVEDGTLRKEGMMGEILAKIAMQRIEWEGDARPSAPPTTNWQLRQRRYTPKPSVAQRTLGYRSPPYDRTPTGFHK